MNTRGSEWRKWDLHVHTPASLCSEYGGDNDEIWEQFIQKIENLCRNGYHAVACILLQPSYPRE